MWEIVEQLMKERNLKIADVQRGTGLPYSTFTDWKAGRYTPKIDKIQKIADFFGVTVNYIKTGKENEEYYIDDEAAVFAQELLKNKELRILMSAGRGANSGQLLLAAQMLEEMKKTNPDG